MCVRLLHKCVQDYYINVCKTLPYIIKNTCRKITNNILMHQTFSTFSAYPAPHFFILKTKKTKKYLVETENCSNFAPQFNDCGNHHVIPDL